MVTFNKIDIRDALKSDKSVTLTHHYGNENTEPQIIDCQAMDDDCRRPITATRIPRGDQEPRALLQHKEPMPVEHQKSVPAECQESVPAEHQEADPAEHQEPGKLAIEQYQQRQYSSPALGIEQYQQRQYSPQLSYYRNFAMDGLMPQPLFIGYSDLWEKERDKRITDNNRTFVARHKSEEAVAGVIEKQDLSAELNDMRRCMSYKNIMPLPKELAVRVRESPFYNLPDSMQRIASSVSAYIDIASEAVYLALLGVIFVACRGNFIIEVKKGYREALTAYLMVVMPSGSRKSALIGFFRHFIDEVEKELQEAYKENASKREFKLKMLKDLKSQKKAEILKEFGSLELGNIDECAEQLAVQLKPIDQEIQNISTPPRFCVDTPTPKAIAIAAQEQGEAIGVYEAEGGLLKHRLNASNNIIYLKGFTMESFGDEVSAGMSVFMEKPCIAMCLFVQSSVLEKVYSNDLLKDDGFVPRILPAFLSNQHYVKMPPMEISEDLMESCSKKIRSLLTLKRPESKAGERTYHTIILSSEAQRKHHEYVEKNKERVSCGNCEGFEAFIQKLAGHAVRLAGAIHVWAHNVPQDHEINEQTMQGGIDLAEYFLQHVSVAYDENRVKALEFAKKILRWMDKHKKIWFTERNALRGVGRCTIVDIRAGLEVLERHNYIGRRVDVKTTYCVVNPNYGFNHAER